MAETAGAEIIRQFNDAKTSRAPLESHIKDCFRYTFPIRGVGFLQSPTVNPNTLSQQAKAQESDMFDSTAPDACTTLASNYMAGLTPANSRWFGYRVEDEDEKSEANAWLDKSCENIHSWIHSSGFDAPAFEGMLDVVPAGMFALYATKGKDTKYQFELWSLANCYFGASRRGGPIDIVYYEFSLTAEQAANEYGPDKLPDKIRKAAEKKPDTRYTFVWCVRPRKAKGKRLTAKERLQPFESFQVETSTKVVLKSDGYHEFPVIVPRYEKIPGSVYARGPFSNALPDTKTLNEAKRLTFASADMAIAGMWGAVDDGVLNPKTVRIGAKRIVFMAKKESFFPLTPGGNFDLSTIIVADLKQSIRRTLNADLLDTKDKGPVETATAWHYKVNLIRQLMGPAYGRFQSEYLQPLVARCFGIALREGWLGRPPEALRRKNLQLQYISPHARAQKAEDVAAMDRFENDLIAKAQLKPDIFDLYDWDAALRRKADLLGVPSDLLPEDKVVKKIRADRQKVQEQQQQAALQMEMAKKSGGQMQQAA